MDTEGREMTKISVSDRAKAIAELERERHALYALSAGLTLRQQEIWENAAKEVKKIGREQFALMTKLLTLEEASEKIMGELG